MPKHEAAVDVYQIGGLLPGARGAQMELDCAVAECLATRTGLSATEQRCLGSQEAQDDQVGMLQRWLPCWEWSSWQSAGALQPVRQRLQKALLYPMHQTGLNLCMWINKVTTYIIAELTSQSAAGPGEVAVQQLIQLNAELKRPQKDCSQVSISFSPVL